MILIANQSAQRLASDVASYNGWELIISDVISYSNAEIEIFLSNLNFKQCVLIIGTSGDSNRTFMELLLHLSALRNMGMEHIHLCLPYLMYSRQFSSSSGPREGLKVIFDAINNFNLASIHFVDTHCRDIAIYVNGANEISHYDIFSKYIPSGTLIVSPDRGSGRRANVYSSRGCSTAMLNKVRSNGQEVRVEGEFKEFYRKDCIIIDDIVDSASTICKAAEFLKESGAGRIGGCVSHNVLNRLSVSRIEDSPIDYLMLSDTNATASFVLKCKKIQIVSAADTISRHLQNIIKKEEL